MRRGVNSGSADPSEVSVVAAAAFERVTYCGTHSAIPLAIRPHWQPRLRMVQNGNWKGECR